ncbi:uncharacterized protein LOC143232223 [Tachypleus tridentatus]|uniref:uncharacterized protein LOC143232223 n=1 Tax=Tachypleus tridentatus TaxID=6853 RepID=UPI003FD42F27
MESSRLVKRSQFYSVVMALLLLQTTMGAYFEEKRSPFNTFRDDTSVWSPQFSYTSLEWKRAQMNLKKEKKQECSMITAIVNVSQIAMITAIVNVSQTSKFLSINYSIGNDCTSSVYGHN